MGGEIRFVAYADRRIHFTEKDSDGSKDQTHLSSSSNHNLVSPRIPIKAWWVASLKSHRVLLKEMDQCSIIDFTVVITNQCFTI